MKIPKRVAREEAIVWRGMRRLSISPREKVVRICLSALGEGGGVQAKCVPCGDLDARRRPRSL
jgi:hypothetical protein